ncbi:MAG: glycosyl hydrolase family 8, partial [Candidatus Margulisiibacteriota bacterium]
KPFELAAVSESGSYALLRAVWMKDRQAFDRVWNWVKDNLQHSEMKYVYFWKDVNSPDNGWRHVDELGIDRDHLFSWRWSPTIAERDRKGIREDGVIYYRWQPPSEGHNPNEPWRDGWDSATDADQDIALALIYADKLWGSRKGDKYQDYAHNAQQVLNDIWKKETYVKREYRYLAGGNGLRAIEPGYLSPFSYRVFDDFDPEHNWLDLVDSSYRIFRDSSTAMLSSWIDKRGISHNQNPHKRQRWPRANLVPDWLSLDKNGQVVDGAEREEAEFGTDAFRALWRVAVDYAWNRDKRAAEYLKQLSSSGPYDFLYYRLHDKRGDWKKTPNYNESQKLASVYWHDGGYTMYEGNYEPDPGKTYVENQTASRASCGQYGVYLSYFYASYLMAPNSKSFDMIERLVSPLITPEANGFSKRSYMIPEDQLKKESARNIARQTPPEKRNPKAEIGIPYHKGDGWYCTDKAGGYWTIFDHSEWNSQMDYYSNTWTWLGLAFFAGVVQNLYRPENKVPDIQDFDVYLDRDYQYKAVDHINAENFFVLARGKDRNPRHRDFFYVKVETTQKGASPIILKVVETKPNSGLYKAMGTIGLESSDAADRVAGSLGKYLTFIDSDKPSLRKTYRIGRVNLTQVIEDFEDGSAFDANPMAWWSDALKPNSGKPKFVIGKDKGIYIWKDKEWHIRFLGNSGHDVFSGMILTDGYIDTAKVVDLHAKDHIQTLRKSINFTCVEDKSSTGIDFTVQGQFVVFDMKLNGYYESNAFAIGVNRDTAFGAPLVLRNSGDTGTYKLKLNHEKAVNSRFSLQVDKKYIGKPYPYLGGVLFNAEHADWTKFDEFSLDLYLEHDVGPIRVDIQDAKGTVGILNEYNPWNDRKGAGWYKWRSNHPYGIGVNAGLVEPF